MSQVASSPLKVTSINSGATGWWGQTSRNCIAFVIYSAVSQSNTYYTSGFSSNGRMIVAAHEIGHALGLDHSSQVFAVMYFCCTVTNGVTALHADDKAGMNAIY